MLKCDFTAGVKKRMFSLRVEEDRRDFGAVEDILQIVGGDALLLHGLVQLAVEGGQFLIERLQLFLRRFQLFIGGLEFLVHRHGFFVDRLLLLVGELEVADGALQLLPRGVELLLELSHVRCIGFRFNGSAGLRPCSGSSMKLTSSSPSASLSTGRTVDTDRYGATIAAAPAPP